MLASTYSHPHFNKQFLALYKASILLLEDGFSFVVEDKHQNLIVYAAEYRIENREKDWPDVYYAQYLNDFLQQDEVYTLPYSVCRIFIMNDVFALVPQALYAPETLRQVLRLQANTVANLSVFANAQEYYDLQLVAGLSENVNGVLQQHLPGGRMYHAGSGLLRMASEGAVDGPQVAGIHLLVTEATFLVCFTSGHQLLSCFAQSFTSAGEIAYYLVNIQQQYHQQFGKLKLVMGGYHPEYEKIKEILSLYFDKPDEFRFEKQIEGLNDKLPLKIRVLYQILQACES